MEVGPLSRGTIFESLSNPLQTGLRFLHPPLPAVPLGRFTAFLPQRGRLRAYRVSSSEHRMG